VLALQARFTPLDAHTARAIAPTAPAALAVLALRALAEHDRTAWWAVGELALFGAITVAATLVLERKLLREIATYLRRVPAPRAA